MGVTVSYSITDIGTMNHPSATREADGVGLANGNYAVVGGGQNGSYMRLFDQSGEHTGGTMYFLDGDGSGGSVSQLTTRGIVHASIRSGGTIAIGVYDDETGSEIDFGTQPEDNTRDVDVAGLSGGGFVVASQDFVTDTDNRIDWRIFDSELNFVAGDAIATGANDQAPSVAALDDGGFAVAFHREIAPGATELWYKVFNADGTVRKAATLLDSAGRINRDASVIALETGGFGIVYQDSGWMGVGNTEISFARFDTAGASLGITNITKNTENDFSPSATLLSNGMVLVGSHNSDAQWTLVDPATGEPLVTTRSGSLPTIGEIDAMVAGGRDGQAAAFYTDTSTNNLVGLRLQAVRIHIGDGASDFIQGDSLRDIIFAGAGNDTILGAPGIDQLFGEGGNDTFYVTNNDQQTRDSLDGGAGSDLMLVAISGGITGASVASFERLGFTDSVSPKTFEILSAQVGAGLSAALSIDGNNQATDTLRIFMRADANLNLSGFKFVEWDAAAGDRILVQGDGDVEAIVGSSQNDTIAAGAGDDRLDGNGGRDRLQGGTGNDVYTVDQQGEAFEAVNAGNDNVRSTVSYTLGANLERLQLLGTGDLVAVGNALGNSITGNAGANRISGRGGNDLMAGGAGTDRFVFDTALDASTNVDRMIDFTSADDTVLLNRSIFSVLPSGTLAIGAFRAGTIAADEGDRIIYDRATGRIFYDSDGAGGAAQILFARVEANVALSNADFVAVGSSVTPAARSGGGLGLSIWDLEEHVAFLSLNRSEELSLPDAGFLP